MNREAAQFFSTAWQAAHAGGAIVREKWQGPMSISHKGAVDLVTSVDRAAERCIVERLRRDFPHHSLLAEEETDYRGSQKGYRWIIDPLDGTTNFAHGYPQFSISIALEREQQLLLGLVYDPLRQECFAAIRGEGATLNGRPIAPSKVAEINSALFGTGFPYDRRQNAEQYLVYFKAFMVRAQGIRRAGSAALDLCYVACGRLDGFWELKLKPWDTAAGTLIVREAGGRVSNFSGGEFSIWGSETMASNGLIHGEMIEVMQQVAESNGQ
jgi:myo-inositol-1(or 4)-monophosphatase